ncbi:MAG: Ig-like domain-containing protein [Flavobacteriales bacterium]
MKTILHLKFALLVSLFLPQLATSQFTSPEQDTRWNIGLNMGGVWQDGDVKLDRPGFGYGFTIGKGIYEDPGKFWSLEARFRYMKGFTYGQELTKLDSSDMEDNTIYSTIPSNYKNTLGYTYVNNKTMIHDFSLEGVVNFHMLRERTGVILSIFGGLGVTDYKTTTNLLDFENTNKIYNYASLTSADPSKDEIQELLDEEYETRALYNSSEDQTVRFMPSLGIALGYQITPRWSFGFEHKVTFALHDEFDGLRREGTQFLQWGDNDKYHYSSAFLRLNIFRGENSTTTRNDNCPPPYLKIADIPNNYVVNEQLFEIRARVSKINSSNDVILVSNDQMIQTVYNKNTDFVTGNITLVEGENKILFIATNKCGESLDSVIVIYNPEFCPKAVISITAPEAIVKTSKAKLMAKVLQLQGGTLQVKLNNSLITHNYNTATRQLTADLNLRVGVNSVSIQAINKCGDTTVMKNIEYKCIAPTVTISNPENGKKYESQNAVANFTAKTTNISELSQVQVLLNGTVITPNFNKKNEVISGKVTLREGSNSLSITVTNDCGTQTKVVNFVYEKPCLLPVVSITAPRTNQNVTTSSITLTGAVTNITSANNVQVRVNGVLMNANFNNGSFSTLVNLRLGANNIQVIGTNVCGTDTENVAITYNCPAPIVAINTPVNGSNLSVGNTTITGTVSNITVKTQMNVSVNGASVPFTFNMSTRTFNASANLATGQNVITVSANTPCGNGSRTSTVNVSAPCPAPNLSITSPQSGTSPKSSIVTLTGAAANVTSQSQLRVTLNGAPQSFSYNSISKTFSSSLNLRAGNNTIVVTATTNCGTDSKTVNLSYNAPCPAPIVTINNPTNGSTANASTITVLGTAVNVASQSQMQITLNGVSKAFSFNSLTRAYSATLNLASGNNIILVSATSNCGTDSKTTNVSYNAPCPAPIISINAPANGSSTTNSSITIAGTAINVVNQNQLRVTLNGVSKAFSFNTATKTYSATLNLVDGNNTVQVSGTTNCGTDSKYVNIAYSKSCPQPLVSIASPRNGLNSSSSTVSFVGNVQNATAANQITLKLNGVAVSKSFNSVTKIVTATLSLNQGGNTIELSATNDCGTDSKSVAASFKCPLPTVNIASPNTGMRYTTNPISFEGFVSGISAKSQVNITLNGAQIPFTYTAATSKFSGTMTLAAGSNTLVATATNQCGTSSKSTAVTYTKMCPKPTVLISTPRNGAAVSNSSVTITGIAANLNNKSEMQLKVNGVNTAFTYNATARTFSATATLKEGNNTILATVSNTCGTDSKTANLVYTKPCPIPTVRIINPQNGAKPIDQFITINGVTTNVTAKAQLTLTLNGVSIPFTFNASDNTFTTTYDLSEGSNVIVARVKNECGTDSKTVTIGYTKPCPKPTVSILNPINGFKPVNQYITIDGRTTNVTNKSQITLTLNGQVIPFTFNAVTNSYATTYDLYEGTNTITVTVTNPCGTDTKTVTIGYTKPCPKPILTVLSPSNGSANTTGLATISGTATNISSNSQLSITVNGSPAPVTFNAATKQFLTKRDVKRGNNVIIVTATNACGSVSKTVNVNYVPPCPKPAVLISSPRSGTSVSGNMVTVSGKTLNLNSKADMQVRVNGKAQAFTFNQSAQTYTATLTLAPGNNAVSVVAATSCGNDTKSISVTSVIPKPIITLTNPALDSSVTGSAQIKINGSVRNISSQSQLVIRVNGATQKLSSFKNLGSGNYIFSAVGTGKQGLNIVTVSATNSAGGNVTKTKKVNVVGKIKVTVPKGEQELQTPTIEKTAPTPVRGGQRPRR